MRITGRTWGRNVAAFAGAFVGAILGWFVVAAAQRLVRRTLR